MNIIKISQKNGLKIDEFKTHHKCEEVDRDSSYEHEASHLMQDTQYSI